MVRTVLCKKLKKELEGLDFPPLPGVKGQEIFDNISKQAWSDWQKHQTMLINEKHLNLMDKEHRMYLMGQMDKFFDNAEVDQAGGYVPPEE